MRKRACSVGILDFGCLGEGSRDNVRAHLQKNYIVIGKKQKSLDA